jgi:hypothetical protein
MMAPETCNASTSHDIDGATRLFFALTLDDYPRENISNFAIEALRLIKIMQGGSKKGRRRRDCNGLMMN